MIPNPDENEDFAYHPSAFEIDPDLWSDEKIVKSDSSEEVIKLRNPNDDLISREDLKGHISELMLVYSGKELNNAILNAIDNAPTMRGGAENDI